MSITLAPDQSFHGPLQGSYVSLPALRAMAAFAGFTGLEVVDEHYDRGNVDNETERLRLAERLGVDPDLMFSFVVLKGCFAPDHSAIPGAPPGALEDAWLRRRALWLADPTNDRADAPLVRHAQNLQAKVDGHEHAMSFLRGALADREADLRREREELVMRRHQVEASRSELRRWRDEMGHVLEIIEK
jgi:hypothetical protein